ncbi:response regulator transcription factor [Treponema sp.]|uniref:response regulator transcription factor n=1 Tax=Treponema sp. TaxID=166 RepID=UPI0025EF2124|nr:response regulator transcription factor [Treponema sp.]MCR5219329.1 response regulator transcription factor [Treponema sp.]
MEKINYFVTEDHSLTNLGIRQFFINFKEFECAGFASTKKETFSKLESLKGNLQLLILDLNLGNESGLDVLKEVKKIIPGLKVLVYSMFTNPGIVSLALEYGADGFVCKDGSEDELIKAAREIINGKLFIHQNLAASLYTYSNLLQSLTKQEQTIFKKIIERKNNFQISEELNLSIRSVENYMSRIYSKLGCRGHEEIISHFG